MTFSVGILYSAQEFLSLADKHYLHVKDFMDDERFILARTKDVIDVVQTCGWVQLSETGNITVTDRGKTIADGATAALKLRLQIADLVAYHRPPWSAKLMHGRKEATAAMPPEVNQCFRECGLLDDWDDDLTDWWAIAGLSARARHSEKLSATGRHAEKLTCVYEKDRTGKSPEWISRDSSYAGFDVLSRHSSGDDTPLSIEVKGSERPPKQADFVVTRHEFGTAQRAQVYLFHLWSISGTAQMFAVPFEEVAKHLPTDRGAGIWQQTRIPFAPFRSFRVV